MYYRFRGTTYGHGRQQATRWLVALARCGETLLLPEGKDEHLGCPADLWNWAIESPQQGFLMAGAVALHIYGYRQAANMAGERLHMNRQGSCPASKALGPYPQTIYAPQ